MNREAKIAERVAVQVNPHLPKNLNKFYPNSQYGLVAIAGPDMGLYHEVTYSGTARGEHSFKVYVVGRPKPWGTGKTTPDKLRQLQYPVPESAPAKWKWLAENEVGERPVVAAKMAKVQIAAVYATCPACGGDLMDTDGSLLIQTGFHNAADMFGCIACSEKFRLENKAWR